MLIKHEKFVVCFHMCCFGMSLLAMGGESLLPLFDMFSWSHFLPYLFCHYSLTLLLPGGVQNPRGNKAGMPEALKTFMSHLTLMNLWSLRAISEFQNISGFKRWDLIKSFRKFYDSNQIRSFFELWKLYRLLVTFNEVSKNNKLSISNLIESYDNFMRLKKCKLF